MRGSRCLFPLRANAARLQSPARRLPPRRIFGQVFAPSRIAVVQW